MSVHPFCPILLDWFSAHGRDLPWRHTRDPYAIWLSEIILQQTRVSQGMAYWERFMEAYPTVGDLAAASEDEVLKLWQGLGYYSRARNLHKAARRIVALGRFPDTLESIRQLSGVGGYTAAAVASMAFGIPAAAVDGNVYRVLSRLCGIDTPINSAEGKRTFQTLADSLIEGADAGTVNQAMMDFGATQCTPKSPDCMRCPFCGLCEARRQGLVDRLPVKIRKNVVRNRHLVYIYIRCRGMTAMRRRDSGKDIWRGLWEPVLVEDAPMPPFEGRLTLLCRDVRHVLSHQVLSADFYLLDTDVRPPLPSGYVWMEEAAVGSHAVPRLVERLLDMLP